MGRLWPARTSIRGIWTKARSKLSDSDEQALFRRRFWRRSRFWRSRRDPPDRAHRRTHTNKRFCRSSWPAFVRFGQSIHRARPKQEHCSTDVGRNRPTLRRLWAAVLAPFRGRLRPTLGQCLGPFGSHPSQNTSNLGRCRAVLSELHRLRPTWADAGVRSIPVEEERRKFRDAHQAR